MKATKQNILDLLYYKCNKIGESVDIIEQIYSYKLLNLISEEVEESIYNYIADRMGLSNKTQLTDEQYNLLKNEGYIN